MMNGHLLACATFGKVIASAISGSELHSHLLQVSLQISILFQKSYYL